VPHHILLKNENLIAEEFELMKKHTQYGKSVIDAAHAKLVDSQFLEFAGEMAQSHHEHWDGNGYPNGLKGEEIPLSGRIMAIADVYDSLVSNVHTRKGLHTTKPCFWRDTRQIPDNFEAICG
jgi:putative two-component system response regulator